MRLIETMYLVLKWPGWGARIGTIMVRHRGPTATSSWAFPETDHQWIFSQEFRTLTNLKGIMQQMKAVTFSLTLFFFYALLLTIAMAQPALKQEENRLCAQLEYIKAIKQQVAKQHWPDFGKREWQGEIRVMTERSIFLVNPEKASLRGHSYEDCACLAAKVVRLKDTVNTGFVMNTNFYDAIAACSDWSISHKVVPNVNDTETWVMMILHEMFHQYQSSQPAFRRHFITMWHAQQYLPQDSIGKLYKKYPVFQRQVQQENDLLLACLQTANASHIDSMLTQLLRIRRTRLTSFKQASGFDIEPDENFEQIAEAGARYIEYQFSVSLPTYPVHNQLAEVDPNYKRHELYKHYQLEDQGRYLYKPSSKYFYALGFNSIRLLEKLKIPFRERLYNKEGASFTTLFKAYLASRQ